MERTILVPCSVAAASRPWLVVLVIGLGAAYLSRSPLLC